MYLGALSMLLVSLADTAAVYMAGVGQDHSDNHQPERGEQAASEIVSRAQR